MKNGRHLVTLILMLGSANAVAQTKTLTAVWLFGLMMPTTILSNP